MAAAAAKLTMMETKRERERVESGEGCWKMDEAEEERERAENCAGNNDFPVVRRPRPTPDNSKFPGGSRQPESETRSVQHTLFSTTERVSGSTTSEWKSDTD